MNEIDLFYIKYTIFLLIVMFIVFAMVHITYFRISNVKNILRATLVQGIISGIVGLLIIHNMYGDINVPILSLEIIIFVLFCTIIFAYGSMGPIMADRSVSVFLLIILDGNKDGKGSGNELANRLGGHAMFAKRYFEHEDVGALEQDGDILTITKKGRRIARFYLFLIKLLKLKKNY